MRERSRGKTGPQAWPLPARQNGDADTEQTIVEGPRSAQVRQGLRRHGMYETALGLVLRGFGRVFGCMLLVCLSWENTQAASSSAIDVEPTRARRLSRAQLEAAASDPAMDLRLDFVHDALAQGDACFGVLDLTKIVSYSWFSNRPTEVVPGFVTRFPAGYYYSYKAFTRPAYRGRGLLRDCQVAAAREFASGGPIRLLTLIERRNVSSLKAFAQVGFRPFGRILLWRTRWFHYSIHGAGCRRHGMRIDAVPLPPASAPSQPEGSGSAAAR